MAEALAGFAAAREEGRAALMPYLMTGFPDLSTSRAVAEAYLENGADVIELGAPFSDPLADGPVVHAAATRSLQAGTRFADVMELCAEIANAASVVPMIYANTVVSLGAQRVADALAAGGAAGMIVPDLPPEEAGQIGEALASVGLPLVPLVAPTTPPDRLRRICAEAEGFVYLVSDTRVTGERDDLPPKLGELIAAAREEASVPVAVGFGIGTPEQAAAVGGMADGVIIGSRLVRAVAEAGGREQAAAAVGEFVRACREAMSQATGVG
jgi:tryptophan synthase alpha chain